MTSGNVSKLLKMEQTHASATAGAVHARFYLRLHHGNIYSDFGTSNQEQDDNSK